MENQEKELQPMKSLKEATGFGRDEKLIYIAGPVSGRDRSEVVAEFTNHQVYFELEGYTVFNPVEQISEECTWEEAMRIALHMLMLCDYIYMIPGWESSRGCVIEHAIAKKLGIVELQLDGSPMTDDRSTGGGLSTVDCGPLTNNPITQ